MRSPRHRRRVVAGLLLAPALTGCFASGGDSSGDDSADGSRLRVTLAFPPAENFSPYGADATLLSRLGVTEGLTKLDANGAAAPALAESWTRENDRNWLFILREATFQDGTEVTPDAVAAARNSLLDTGDPVSILASDFTRDGSYNLALLCGKEVDEAVAAAEKEPDTAKRQRAAMNAEAAILATDATVPLVHQRIITGVGTAVKGVILDPYERTLVGTGTRR